MMSVGAFSRSGLKISHTVHCSNRTSLICCAAAGKKTRVTFNLPKKVGLCAQLDPDYRACITGVAIWARSTGTTFQTTFCGCSQILMQF